jgi:hypothetical protein
MKNNSGRPEQALDDITGHTVPLNPRTGIQRISLDWCRCNLRLNIPGWDAEESVTPEGHVFQARLPKHPDHHNPNQ